MVHTSTVATAAVLFPTHFQGRETDGHIFGQSPALLRTERSILCLGLLYMLYFCRRCVCPSPAWPGTAHLYALLLPWRCPPCQANAIWLLWKHSHFFGLCLWARCISQLVMTGGWWEWVWLSTRVLIKPEIQRLQEKITQIYGCPPLQRLRFGKKFSCLHGFMAGLPHAEAQRCETTHTMTNSRKWGCQRGQLGPATPPWRKSVRIHCMRTC